MARFFVALAGGLAWMGLRGDVGVEVFAVGAVLGLLTWRAEGGRPRGRFSPARALRIVWHFLRFVALFLWELGLTAVDQLRIVLSPRMSIEPGWVRFGTELETPSLRALLAAVVSLTPGSLTYETGSEGEEFVIYLHVLHLEDEAQTLHQIRTHLEAPLLAMERA